MFTVGEVMVEEEIAHARFACDLPNCRGACCTLPGGRGAPLMDSELAELGRAFGAAAKYLPDEHRRAIEKEGMFEGVPGSYTTTCLNDRDCVFVYYEGRVARCALERAYQNGEASWRKPLSCHLFPIRISSGPAETVRYEKIAECSAGRALGREADVPLYDFLKESLVRHFGQAWYEEFRAECIRRDPQKAHPDPHI